ncbi:hypothetical protein Ocin01_17871 [Orchesella cincta]|uniref:Uncharacterized protein n=1 Tax=Orchesella cincta TaxID=48709 RepID=A0A1D2M750_ORCCI|nr:hypothetical protein Ocin01_17871 [Orchesella cincta]
MSRLFALLVLVAIIAVANAQHFGGPYFGGLANAYGAGGFGVGYSYGSLGYGFGYGGKLGGYY